MKLDEITSEQEQQKLDEILPAIGAVAGGIARGAAAMGSAALKGAKAVGGAVGGAVAKGAQAVGQAASGLAGGGMDPAQAAMAAKERQDQKKQYPVIWFYWPWVSSHHKKMA